MSILCIGWPIIAPIFSTGIWPDRREGGRAFYSLVLYIFKLILICSNDRYISSLHMIFIRHTRFSPPGRAHRNGAKTIKHTWYDIVSYAYDTYITTLIYIYIIYIICIYILYIYILYMHITGVHIEVYGRRLLENCSCIFGDENKWK